MSGQVIAAVTQSVKAKTRYEVECWSPVNIRLVGVDAIILPGIIDLVPEFEGQVIEVHKSVFDDHLVDHSGVEVVEESYLKWTDGFENLVVTVGLNKLLDATFKTGLASPAWYIGLKGTGTPAAGDTMASHGTWSEITPYSAANRPTYTPGTISGGSVDNSAAKAVFNINASSTIYGCFSADDDTKGGSTGILYGAGDFSASRAVQDGDTLNVTVTKTVTAA